MSPASADATTVRPASRAGGHVRVPGDKSISHRYALLAALADGESHIVGYSPGADCAATLACLRGLGVQIERTGDRLTIRGLGVRGLRAPDAPLDAANSGTTMRLLAGIVAAHPFQTIIGGDASLARRPMRRIIEPLTRMGARISSIDGRPPLTINGTGLHAIAHRPEVPSAQVKSGVLLAGLQATGRTTVTEPAPTRDHTERALAEFGAEVLRLPDGAIAIDGGQRLTATHTVVPGDISGATFWAVLAAGTPGGSIDMDHVGLNPTRSAVLDVLSRAGAQVETRQDETTSGGEPIGRLRVSYGGPRSFSVDPHEVPGLIDEIPALAALAAMMPPGHTFTVRGAAELRVKESDRIASLARGFRALGAGVDEYEDGFVIEARPLTGGVADAVGDHRLAMAFALAATRGAAPSTIAGATAVDVSYPGFFEELARLTGTR
jgi:3-phosphoshikimate 1-carboxyvinyltransferase